MRWAGAAWCPGGVAGVARAGRLGAAVVGRGPSGGCGGGAVELEQVVGGGDELPFGVAGGQAASSEAGDASEVLDVAEDRFDDLLSSGVERVAVIGGEDRVVDFPRFGGHGLIRRRQ